MYNIDIIIINSDKSGIELVSHLLGEHGIKEKRIHTAGHYDEALAKLTEAIYYERAHVLIESKIRRKPGYTRHLPQDTDPHLRFFPHTYRLIQNAVGFKLPTTLYTNSPKEGLPEEIKKFVEKKIIAYVQASAKHGDKEIFWEEVLKQIVNGQQ